MAVARRLVVNPSDPDQRYVLFSNGYIQELGGALPIKQSAGSVNNWPSQDAPTFYTVGNPDIAVSLQIIDWTIPSGYTLDVYGHVWPWGGAALVPGGPGAPLTGGAEYFFGLNGGFASPQFGFVVDFMMDPGNTGKGYLVRYDGGIIAIGTGVTAVPSFPGVTAPSSARALFMDWSSKRYWLLDGLGRIIPFNGAAATAAVVDVNGGSAQYPAYIWGRGGNFSHGGARIYDYSATPKGFVLDSFGRAYRLNGALFPYGSQVTLQSRVWVDLAIIDDGTGANPLRLAALRENGTINEWVVSSAPWVQLVQPTSNSTITNATRPWVRWSYFDTENNPQASWEFAIYLSTQYQFLQTSEVQRLTPSGTISGGTFRIRFPVGNINQETTDIAYNASAATIQAALEALPAIGTGGVLCAGGPINTAFVSITFQNQMGYWDWPQVTIVSALTGSSPVITPSTTTAGTSMNPAAAGGVIYRSSGTGTTIEQQPNVDLANGTYRAFVRVTDSSGLTSAWYYTQFVQNVTVPATPTVTPTVVGGVTGVSLALHVNPAGLDANARFALQYHDSDWDGSTWSWVQGGYGPDPDGSGNATVIDYEARHGIVRTYRAFVYIYDAANDAWIQGAYSTTATATNTGLWRIVNPLFPAQNQIVDITSELVSPQRPIVAATFYPAGRTNAVVMTDGTPKSASFDVKLGLLSKTQRDAINTLLTADDTLLLLDPLGRSWFFRPVGNYGIQTNHEASTPTDEYHVASFSAQEVDRPMAGPIVGPFAFTG